MHVASTFFSKPDDAVLKILAKTFSSKRGLKGVSRIVAQCFHIGALLICCPVEMLVQLLSASLGRADPLLAESDCDDIFCHTDSIYQLE